MCLKRALAAAAATTLVFTLIGPAWAGTIRVPKDQPTIQEAVLQSSDGDVIEIKGGNYVEDVVVTGRTNLTLLGKGAVTLRPTGTGLTATNCTNLVVQNLRVRGGRTGFDLQNCAGARLEKFSVKDCSDDAVRVAGGSDIRVVRGKVSNCGGDGISFGEEGESNVRGGEVTRVKIKNCEEDGVDVEGSDVTVSKCRVTNAGDDGFEHSARSPGPVTFDRCTTKNSADEGFEFFGPRTTATRCKTTNADADGFDVEGDDSVLENCTAVNSGDSGLEIEGANNVILRNCKSIRSNDNGFDLRGATDSLVEGCKAIRSDESGFFLDQSASQNTLRNNRASRSKGVDLENRSTGQNDIDASNRFKTTIP